MRRSVVSTSSNPAASAAFKSAPLLSVSQQELLVLALQVLLEDDAPDVEAAVLVSEACLLLAVRRVEVRVVVDFAGPADAGVKRLRGLVLAIQRMRIKQVSAVLRQDDSAIVVAEVNGVDQPLIAEVVEGIVVDVEFVLGNDTEGADRGQCSAVLAVQFVDSVTINDQLALLAARQVEVVHQAVARIVVVAVALLVDARPPVVAIPLAVFARIIPSSVRHRSLLAWVLAVWVVREDALAVSARAGSGRRRSAGAFRRGVQGVVVLNLGSPVAQGDRVVGSAVPQLVDGSATDRELLLSLIRPCWVASQGALVLSAPQSRLAGSQAGFPNNSRSCHHTASSTSATAALSLRHSAASFSSVIAFDVLMVSVTFYWHV
jgi:hypothetical protein